MSSKQTNWREVALGSVSEKIGMGPFGSNIKVETFQKTGIPVISGNNLKGVTLGSSDFNFVSVDHADSLISANVYPGDVIFTHAGNIKNVAYIPEDSKYKRYILSQRQFFLRCKKAELDPAYVTYYFKSPEGQYKLLANSSSVGVPSIAQPVSYLRSLTLDLPPLPVQQSIVKILRDLDQKIELNRKMNKTLEEMGQVLFKHYFIDNPEAEGWNKVTLGTMVSPQRGMSLSRKDMKEGNIPVVSGGLEPSGYHEVSNTIAPTITISASGANAGFVRLWHDPVWSADSSFIDSSVTSCVYFFYIFLKMKQVEIYSMQTGAAQPHIYPSHLERLEIMDIPLENIGMFNDLVTPFFWQIRNNEKENEDLSKIRIFLLPRLMSGKIQI